MSFLVSPRHVLALDSSPEASTTTAMSPISLKLRRFCVCPRVPSHTSSFGEVFPVFWDQQGVQIGSQNIRLTRSSNATQPAFDRHFSRLSKKYGLIHVVDLLCQKDNHVEYTLSNAFEFQLKQLGTQHPIQYTSFDFNSICGKNSLDRLLLLNHYINKDLQLFGFFYYDYNSKAALRAQRGVFRVNCLDCLDRTNVVQEFISRKVIELFVRSYLIPGENGTLLREHASIWADNGDILSIIYAGTKALKTSYTRTGRMGIFAIVDDMTKSAKRAIVHNFKDKDKQKAIDDLLGLTAIPAMNRDMGEETVGFLNVRIFSWNTSSCSISPSILRESDFFKPSEVPDVFIFALQRDSSTQCVPNRLHGSRASLQVGLRSLRRV